MKHIIILVGMPGSGKEEFVKVAEKNGFSIIRMGDTVREEAKKRGVEFTDKNIGSLAHSEREKHGYDIWAMRTLEKINKITEKKIVIDGCRGEAEVKIFKQNFSDLDVVGIFSSPESRYDRLRERNRSDAPITMEEFYERDQRELAWGIGNAFIMADYMINNEGTLEDCRKEAIRILNGIIKKD